MASWWPDVMLVVFLVNVGVTVRDYLRWKRDLTDHNRGMLLGRIGTTLILGGTLVTNVWHDAAWLLLRIALIVAGLLVIARASRYWSHTPKIQFTPADTKNTWPPPPSDPRTGEPLPPPK